jgi:protein-disulfide isomerase
MKKVVILLIAVLIVSIAGIYIFEKKFNSTKSHTKSVKNSDSKKFLNLPNLSSSKFSSAIEGDRIIGSKEAKITIIEYASLSCSHCASFHKNNFDLIEEKLIKTGKVKFIYRDFPLNFPALVASISASCLYQQNQDNQQYHRYIKSLFVTQENWALSKDFENQIKKISALYGLKNKNLQKCLKDEGLKKKIIQSRVDGSKEMKVNSTPTIFINGVMLNGAVDFKKIEEVIEFISNES